MTKIRSSDPVYKRKGNVFKMTIFGGYDTVSYLSLSRYLVFYTPYAPNFLIILFMFGEIVEKCVLDILPHSESYDNFGVNGFIFLSSVVSLIVS